MNTLQALNTVLWLVLGLWAGIPALGWLLRNGIYSVVVPNTVIGMKERSKEQVENIRARWTANNAREVYYTLKFPHIFALDFFDLTLPMWKAAGYPMPSFSIRPKDRYLVIDGEYYKNDKLQRQHDAVLDTMDAFFYRKMHGGKT